MEQSCDLSQRSTRHQTSRSAARHIFSSATIPVVFAPDHSEWWSPLASFTIRLSRAHRHIRSQWQTHRRQRVFEIRVWILWSELDGFDTFFFHTCWHGWNCRTQKDRRQGPVCCKLQPGYQCSVSCPAWRSGYTLAAIEVGCCGKEDVRWTIALFLVVKECN